MDSPQTPIIENTPLIAAVQGVGSAGTEAGAGGIGVIGSIPTLTTFRPPSLLNNHNNNTINNNNNNLQYINHNLLDANGGRNLNFSTTTFTAGNDLQLNRMNGGLNNGTSSSSAGGGVNLGVGESKRKTIFQLQQIQEC